MENKEKNDLAYCDKVRDVLVEYKNNLKECISVVARRCFIMPSISDVELKNNLLLLNFVHSQYVAVSEFVDNYKACDTNEVSV